LRSEIIRIAYFQLPIAGWKNVISEEFNWKLAIGNRK
jgi:hypothetical protein